MKKINDKQNIFGDNIAFVEQYDFSTANMSEENRILAITQVASICYQNPKALGSESLYNRLLAESQGLPSSSAEFVPILIPLGKIYHRLDVANIHIRKFGEIIKHNAEFYLLTNFRAIVYDVENERLEEEWLKFFNTEEDCEIIKQHFKVFLYKVDLPTRSQMVRHRVSWQELSRRYVSGKKHPFEFYVSEKMQGVISEHFDDESNFFFDTSDIIDICLEHYNEAIAAGVKPEEARRILPQAMKTTIWGAFQPAQLANFFTLRLDKSAQREIRTVAEAMKELI